METLSQFFTDPLRLTLGVAAIVVLLGILLFGRKTAPRYERGPKSELTRDQITEALTRNDDDNVTLRGGNTELSAKFSNSQDGDTQPKPFAAKPVSEDTIPAIETETVDESISIDQTITVDADMVTRVDEGDEKELFVVLHVVSLDDKSFIGQDIQRAMDKAHLVYGQYKIFHYPHPDNDTLSLFSVVNMLKPGFFDQEALDNLTTTGLSFFMRMPVMPGLHEDVFTTMLATAQNVTRSLGGQLLDEEHNPLTQSGVDQIKQRIREFDQQDQTESQHSS